MTRLRLLLLLVVLAAACSLPLPKGVHVVGEVPAAQRQAGPLQVIPPGPKAGQTPVQAVLGFLGAQASSDNSHGIARAFLSPGERVAWRDDTGVQVYDPDRLTVQQLPARAGSQVTVQVTMHVSASISPDGSYAARLDAPVTEDYQLSRGQGRWQLDQVPAGLRLTAADRQRAFVAEFVYYLAPLSGEAPPHLVPDLVFVPADADLPRTLVSRLLHAPSQALAGSVTTAVPDRARLARVTQSGSGVVTVDLDGVGSRPRGVAAQNLSAQLVWTLRGLGAGFRGLRLRVDGSVLAVPGEHDVQDPGEWDAYDPEGLGPSAPYFFVSHRRLRSSADLAATPAVAGQVGDGTAVPVDEVAVTADRTEVAVVEDTGTAPSVVRVGPLRGPGLSVVGRGGRLSSPTWGSGAHGLWLLRDRREVVRVDNGLRPVTVVGAPAGALSSLALSRDGVRVALVAGGRLYVGRVDLTSGEPRVVGLAPVLPTLRAVRRVSWASSTSLVVLGVLTRVEQVVQLSVDGSSVATLNTAGLLPTDVAASPDEVVVVSGGRLYRSTGGAFREVTGGTGAVTAPVYPG